MKTSTRRLRHAAVGMLVGAALGVVACLAAMPSAALGFGTFTGVDPSGFSDLATNANDFASWDQVALTYRFDASFDTNWPNALVKNQVRLAFSQWDTANATADGAVYSYGRANGWQAFGDIRSIVVHELGHVIGMHHPDQAHAANRNWQQAGGGVVAVADQNNEVMRSWINPGDYNHVLSHDELDAFNYMYGHDLNFTEAPGGVANIVISAYNPGDPNNWASGGGNIQYRTPGNHAAGMRFVDGFVNLNLASGQPLGLRTLGINWDFQNAGGKPCRSFVVETNGTNNPTPIFHYDNNGVYEFNTFSTGAVDADHKDNLRHRWSNSAGGDIPAAEIIHVGLEQDVWDWSVVSASVNHPDGTSSAAPLLSFHEWSNTIVTGTPAAPPDLSGTLDMRGEIKVLARGFSIIAPEGGGLVSHLGLACVDGLGLGLDDLNRETLGMLRERQMLEEILDFGERTLEPGEEFVVVLEGGPQDLPPELLESENFMFLDRPMYLDQELFIFARSQNQDLVVGTYGLLGTGVITPEPASLTLLGLGLAALVARRRRKA